MKAEKGPFGVSSCSSEWGNTLRERLSCPLDGEVALDMRIKFLSDNTLCIYKFSFQFLKMRFKRDKRNLRTSFLRAVGTFFSMKTKVTARTGMLD